MSYYGFDSQEEFDQYNEDWGMAEREAYDEGHYYSQQAEYKYLQDLDMNNWVKVSERKPERGKLVYTKNDKGYIAAFTLYEHGWNTKLSDVNAADNSRIIEWLEQ